MSTTTLTTMQSAPPNPRPPKRTPVPLLLESFPVPPSHIPPTPTTPVPLSSVASTPTHPHNPPPSGPPSTPLPPVPGPSRISEHEQLLLLSSAVNRSRRSSKYSVTSSTSVSQRESVISVTSSAGAPGGSSSSRTSVASDGPSAAKSTPLPPPSPRRDSALSSSGGRPSISVSSSDRPQLTRLSISPVPLSDDDLPPSVMPSPTLPRAASTINGSTGNNGSTNFFFPSSRRRNSHHQANESISSIDMRDLLGLDTVRDEDEDEPLGGLPPPPRKYSPNVSPSNAKFGRRQYHHHQASLADPIDPNTIYTRTKPEDRPTPTHKSSPSIGSFSLPSSSKYSPVTVLAPFVPSSSASSTSTARPAPALLSSTYAYVSAPADESALPPSISTTTQRSSSPISNSPLLDSSPPSSLLELDHISSTASASVDSLEYIATTTSPSSSSLGVTSPTIKDMRLGFRAERTRSAGLKHVLRARSRSRSVAAERERMPEPDVGLPPVPAVPVPASETSGPLLTVNSDKDKGSSEEKETKESGEEKRDSASSTASGVGLGLGLTGDEMGKVLSGIVITKTTKTEVEVLPRGGGMREMTLDELGPAPTPSSDTAKSQVPMSPKKSAVFAFLPQKSTTTRTITSKSDQQPQSQPQSQPISHSTPRAAKAHLKTQGREDPRSPSPDIATILSSTPRPALSKSASSASHSKRERRRRVDSAASAGSSKGRGSGPVSARPGMGTRRVSEGSTGTGAMQYQSFSLNRISTTSSAASASVSASRFSGGSLGFGRTKSLEGRALRSGAGAGAGGIGRGAQEEAEEEYDEELEKVLEGEGSEQEEDTGDSDSSLDLHTPLPHLMVRDGLLSPHSKLLPGAASRAATPMDGRPGSSMMTKSGIIKDERDTPMRRTRHRDGKLLKGGLGLTTGLGWSDSEDEDAPSPLTRRLSALNLSRRSSASSIMTGTSSSRPMTGYGPRHPLSRSFSSGALTEHQQQQSRRSFAKSEFDEFDDEYLEEEEEGEEGEVVDNTLKETGEWAQAQRQRSRSRIPSGGSSIPSRLPGKSSLPPTSWQHRTTASGISKSSNGTATTRTSTSSVGSTFSLEVTPAYGYGYGGETTAAAAAATRTPSLSRIRTPSGGAHHGLGSRRDSTGSSGVVGIGRPSAMKKGSRDDVSVTTPSSTASTLSIPMPATPKDADPDPDERFSSSTTPVPGSKIRSLYNKDKSLPPLPLRGVPSLSRMDGAPPSTATPGTQFAFPRARTFSSTSSASASASASTPSPTPTSPGVRPLQLPRHAAATRGAGGDRPAVPVPSVSASRGSLRMMPSLGSAGLSPAPTSPHSIPSSPLPSPDLNGSGIARPKPRTGTGMVYRTTSTKMRPPMVLSSSSLSTSVSALSSNGAGVGSIGRGGRIGKPIAL